MRAPGSGPTSQQNVQTNTQVHQRDEPQAAIQRAIGRNRNQRSFQRHTLSHQRVVRLRPNSHAIELAFQAADVDYVVPIHGNQAIAFLYAGLLSGTINVDPLGP